MYVFKIFCFNYDPVLIVRHLEEYAARKNHASCPSPPSLHFCYPLCDTRKHEAIWNKTKKWVNRSKEMTKNHTHTHTQTRVRIVFYPKNDVVLFQSAQIPPCAGGIEFPHINRDDETNQLFSAGMVCLCLCVCVCVCVCARESGGGARES
jgi:hypothetical protein